MEDVIAKHRTYFDDILENHVSDGAMELILILPMCVVVDLTGAFKIRTNTSERS